MLELYLIGFIFTVVVLAWCAPKAPSYKSNEWKSWLVAAFLGGTFWPLGWVAVMAIKVMLMSDKRNKEEK